MEPELTFNLQGSLRLCLAFCVHRNIFYLPGTPG